MVERGVQIFQIGLDFNLLPGFRKQNDQLVLGQPQLIKSRLTGIYM